MKIILLSGGSGKRLWPLSNSVMSKQFLEILPTSDGKKESMVQRVYRQIRKYTNEEIFIVAPEIQRELIKQQLGDTVEFVSEPCRRGTYNAIQLACSRIMKHITPDKFIRGSQVDLSNSYIAIDKNGFIQDNGCTYSKYLNEQVCVIPIDIFVEDDFFNILNDIERSIKTSNKMITLVGIKPTYPSTNYGYIVPDKDKYRFFEKPDKEKATEYIDAGGLWNAGIFGFSLEIYRYLDEDFVRYHYINKPDVSFDCAVCEKTDSISVVKYDGQWKDIGTWSTLSEEIDSYQGIISQENCTNTTIINTLNKPLIALGLDNAVVAVTHDGIIVSNKDESYKVKNYVKDSKPFFEKRRWGEYYILDYGDGFLTKRLKINAGKSISYQVHNHRKEVWTIVSGEGILTINDVQRCVGSGDTIVIDIGEKYKISATSDVTFIETQLGDILDESDIERCHEDSLYPCEKHCCPN